ncbi:uncharacterized protein LOC109795021 [Cajanus cajan]|uniref:Uncharacterized protein n=1 Tax=Cajanus cajan TaxID=3821 RepID=A0A151U167_CAJCA|nr:uncharacterized protein LOC109795021 [Cajanus cajan]KYP73037.1 hypothetical protein KK1_005644 [Cajanus cajan]
MARPLLLSSSFLTLSMPLTVFCVALAVLSVFSVITFLCGSDKLNKFHKQTQKAATRSKEQKMISKLNSNLGHRALSMAKMLSWRKVQAEGEEADKDDEEEDDDEEALWRKNILMGEKCRPLNFSEPKS